MKPSEISLFTAKEQSLLVSTESKRLEGLDEDALADLLGRVRRARNKYRDLERRQSTDAIAAAGRRSVSSSAAERTLRKAEIFEDAISRVARHLSRAARANANDLKRARIDATKRSPAPTATPARAGGETATAPSTEGKQHRDIVEPAQRGSVSARNKRSQARTDSTRTPKS